MKWVLEGKTYILGNSLVPPNDNIKLASFKRADINEIKGSSFKSKENQNKVLKELFEKENSDFIGKINMWNGIPLVVNAPTTPEIDFSDIIGFVTYVDDDYISVRVFNESLYEYFKDKRAIICAIGELKDDMISHLSTIVAFAINNDKYKL